jgi:uncharacterized protein YecE (DUF72 family)
MAQRASYDTFDVVEVQQTFYKPPQLATVRRWRAEAREGFEFTMKAFQAITHPPRSPTYRRSGITEAERAKCGSFRDTPVVRQAWKTTLELARALEAVLVVFQCPPSFEPTAANVENLIRFFEWAHRDRIRLGWEPRGEAWTDDLVRRLCRELSLTHVVDPFLRVCLRPRPPYFRLHGIGGHEHVYSDQELFRLRETCSEPLTYCLFNNASMVDDARRFRALLDQPPGR